MIGKTVSGPVVDSGVRQAPRNIIMAARMTGAIFPALQQLGTFKLLLISWSVS